MKILYKTKPFLFILCILLIVSFLSIGITRCLPMRCYSDESKFISPTAFFLHGKFDQLYKQKHIWGHPAHTLIHLVWLNTLILYLIEKVFLKTKTIDQFIMEQKANQFANVFLIGRIINLIFSLGTVYLTWLITKRILESKNLNKKFAYLSIVSLLTNGLFLIYGKFTRMDIPQTFFTLLAVFFLRQNLTKRKKSEKEFFFFGLAVGLATMTKWPGVLTISLAVVPILSTLFSSEKQKLRKITNICLFSLIGLVVGFFLGSPLWPKYITQIKRDVITEARPHHLGADNLGFWGNFLFYQKVLISSFGLSAYLFFLGGIFLISKRWRELKENLEVASILCFLFIYLIATSYLKLHWSRWIIPLLPFFSIISTVALASALNKIKNKLLKIGLLTIVFLTPLAKSLIYNYAITKRDTRVLAKNWINFHLGKAKINYDGYTPSIPDRPTTVALKDLDHQKEMGIQYLVVSSAMYKRYLAEPERYHKIADFYTNLFENYPLVVVFPSNPISQNYQNDIVYDWEFWRQFLKEAPKFFYLPLGPEIRIYKIQ